MADTLVEAPKMFREMDGIKLENVQLPNALETFWYCRNIELKNVQIDNCITDFYILAILERIVPVLDENLKAPGNCELKLWDDLTCFN